MIKETNYTHQLDHRRKLIFVFCLGMFLLSPIGALQHEAGHYVVASHYNYYPKLTHSSTKIYDAETIHEASRNSKEGVIKELFFRPINKDTRILVTLAGFLMTFLTGLLCFLVFLKLSKRKFGTIHVLLLTGVFLLGRTVVVPILHLINLYFFNRRGNFDEAKIIAYLHINDALFCLFFVGVSVVLICYAVFRLTPSELRFPYIKYGIPSFVTGYALWFYVIGQVFF